jgi:hypothetical protein
MQCQLGGAYHCDQSIAPLFHCAGQNQPRWPNQCDDQRKMFEWIMVSIVVENIAK